MMNLDIFSKCDFSDGIDASNFEECIMQHLPRDYEYKYGASKLCIIPPSDIVYKIPFCRDYDEYTNDTYDFLAGAGKDGFDYCLSEVYLYHIAKKLKIQQILNKTKLLGYIDDYPIYSQLKATINRYKNKTHSQEERNNTKKIGNEHQLHSYYPIDWLTDVLNYYGEKQYLKILKFMNEYVTDVDDDNIGYINQRPVIIDYSGFCE